MDDDILPLWSGLELPLAEPFTTAQARARGIGADRLRRLHREGVVRRVFRGVYIDAAADDDLTVRAQALSLVVPPTAVVTDECAAWVRGVDLVARNDHVIPPP
ncbi:MAG: type IV toxin-antitoxin system AbiEi family antitoxin domain-containing protein, partial [Nocardioidaceae bacterium]